ncbi:MarR family winged helix-turn-helix transcriptional regulator [Streptomyces pseudovenezuelae]|uniref:DNA-binding MarR family transcriptional regulator n=1 Tax=Streptomyces pseudovenezuelae TaxID=67350 RepID=A0ABT6LDB7_9ACTN|nr:MarR family transcriptional regulator [Streptomyces pseudovenezuelae]MDH6214306.1 DNA-binding MarR family transcriptional regulator [Streptomyces pseudovenezuelae]
MERVLADLGKVIQDYQSAVDDYDRETARLLGVNETDLRCLELLLAAGELSPRELSTRLGLTTGSVTAMLDRLENLDLLNRTPHPVDRRKTVVRVTPEGARRCYELIAPHIEDGVKEVSAKYGVEQLQLVMDFLRTTTTIQTRHTERLRALPAPKSERGRRGK